MTRNEWVKITDNPYSAKFLIYIYEHGKIKKSELQQFVNSQTLNQTVDFLIELGMIRTIEQRVPKRRIDLLLTEKGARTARRFIEIEEDPPEDDHISHTSGERVCYEDKSSKGE